MPSFAGHGNSCDSSRSPSTFATALTVVPAAMPLNSARPFSSVFTIIGFVPPADLDRMSLDVVRELSANQPYGYVSGRQIRDRPGNARHLLRIGHLELGGRGRGESEKRKAKSRKQARSSASSLVPHDLQNFASSSFTVAQDGQIPSQSTPATPIDSSLPSALLTP